MDQWLATMNRIKGRLWMHYVGGTLMDGQHISWDDTRNPKLRCEMVRTHLFPFVSYSAFHSDGYRMLKDLYIDLPPSRTWRFLDYLLHLWTEDQVEEARAGHAMATDPVEKAKVHDMSDADYEAYWQEQVRKLHRRIPKDRTRFLALSKMDGKALDERIRDIRRRCKKRIRALRQEIPLSEWLSYQISLRWWQVRGAIASSLVIALIAVSIAEIVKMVVAHWLEKW